MDTNLREPMTNMQKISIVTIIWVNLKINTRGPDKKTVRQILYKLITTTTILTKLLRIPLGKFNFSTRFQGGARDYRIPDRICAGIISMIHRYIDRQNQVIGRINNRIDTWDETTRAKPNDDVLRNRIV